MVSRCKGSGIDLNQGLHIVILGEQIVKIEVFRPFFVTADETKSAITDYNLEPVHGHVGTTCDA